ncbi:hypothetical protein ACVXZ4_14595 [Lacisediminihabitans sp. FW035]
MHLYPKFARTHVRLIALLLASLFLATGFSGSAANAEDTNGISGAPANETGADGRSRFSYQISPGQQLQDGYLVRNTGTTSQTMTVFATDAFNTPDGGYGLLDTDAKAEDSGAWVTFAGGAKALSLPIAAGASQLVPFTLTVPADASPGDHAAGLVISVLSPSGQVLVDRRVATRLYVRVPGALQATLTVGNIAAKYAGQLNPFTGTTSLVFTVKNNGNVALAANAVVGVNTYFGIGASSIRRASIGELLPGASRVITMSVPGVGQLGYLNPYIHLLPTVEKDALDPGPLREIDRDTVLFVPPWWLIILLVIAAAVWPFLVIRRKRNDKNAAAWIEQMEAEAKRKYGDESELVGANSIAISDSPEPPSSHAK